MVDLVYQLPNCDPTNTLCQLFQRSDPTDSAVPNNARVSLKAPLVMLKLLPPIFLFHLVQSFRFFVEIFVDLFSMLGNFLTVRDPPYCENLRFSECGF